MEYKTKELYKRALVSQLNELNKIIQVPYKLLNSIDFFNNKIENFFKEEISANDGAKKIVEYWGEASKTDEFREYSRGAAPKQKLGISK